MEFRSILNLKTEQRLSKQAPVCMVDINADQIVEEICKGYNEELKYDFFYFPQDSESMDYRRAVLQDVKKPPVREALNFFRREMKAFEEAREMQKKVQSPLQRKAWLIELGRLYTEMSEGLYERLQQAETDSLGLNSFRDYLNRMLGGEAFMELKARVMALKDKLAAFRITLSYENNRLILADYKQEDGRDYEEFLRTLHPKHQAELKNLFGTEVNFSAIEQDLMNILIKKQPEFFKQVELFWKKWEHFEDETLLLFGKEIEFYLAVLDFMDRAGERGFFFCVPQNGTWEELFWVEGAYDLALALAKGDEQEIVDNDFSYGKEERFFVVTGPNQGGKTTFARSIGQTLYFYKMGLDVPAKSATIPFFHQLMTHFSVEESVETGQGKLKEELVRLAPMLKKEADSAYVIINELFTTAANYDAIEMGTRTLKNFLEKGYYGIYVTHLGELTRGNKGIVSMMAGTDENGIQTFRIERKPAMDFPCAVQQIEKHRLGYEQVKERLSWL